MILRELNHFNSSRKQKTFGWKKYQIQKIILLCHKIAMYSLSVWNLVLSFLFD